MKKTAILIDGEWFRQALRAELGEYPVAKVMYDNALRTLDVDQEEIYRVFYYDSEPFAGSIKHPITGADVDFKKVPATASRKRFFAEMGRLNWVAVRRGVVKPRGWVLRKSYTAALMRGSPSAAVKPEDLHPSFEQKGVDMCIGIDVASLAIKRLVERIILISGDNDLIPAMKLARREGVQVILVEVDGRRPTSQMMEDADLVRKLTPSRESRPKVGTSRSTLSALEAEFAAAAKPSPPPVREPATATEAKPPPTSGVAPSS